jgi:hypothetical protein
MWNWLPLAIIGPGREAELPDAKPRPVVHAEHRVAREALEQAVVDHLLRAGAAFLGRLEDEIDGAVERLDLRQVLGRTQQHRGVAIMAARVHLAGVGGGVGKGVGLLDRQRIHVGAQADAAAAAAVADHAHHAGAAETAMHLDAPGGEPFGHEVTGAMLFVAQLGVGVQVAPQRFDVGPELDDAVDQLHGGSRLGVTGQVRSYPRHPPGPSLSRGCSRSRRIRRAISGRTIAQKLEQTPISPSRRPFSGNGHGRDSLRSYPAANPGAIAPGASAGMASRSALRGPLNTDSSRPPGRIPQEEHA